MSKQSKRATKKFMTKKRQLLIGSALVAIGIAGVSPAMYYRLTNSGSVEAYGTRPSIATIQDAIKEEPLVTGHPTRIEVPSLQMDFQVIDGAYNSKTQEWTLTKDKTQFALLSVAPNNKEGNTLIYAHALPALFGQLSRIQADATVHVYTDNGYKFTYLYQNNYATSPTDTSLFNYRGPAMLTLQTCSGTWYQNRQMYQFSYVGYQKVTQ